MRLKKIINSISCGFSFREKIENDLLGCVYVIQAKDIQPNSLNTEATIKIKVEDIKEKFVLRDDDILLTNKGRFSSCVFKNLPDKTFIASSGMFVINVHSENYLPEYISMFLNSNKGQCQITSKLETMTIPSLTKESLLAIEIPDVSIVEQQQLINVTKAFMEYESLVSKKISLCKKIIGVK